MDAPGTTAPLPPEPAVDLEAMGLGAVDLGGVGLGAMDLEAMADAVLLPGFGGLAAPEWVQRRVSRALGGVCLFARNIDTPAQVRELTDSLRAQRADVIVSVDEEAGDVTRLDAHTGSRYPGNAALGRIDDVAVTARVAADVATRLAELGITLNLAPCADVLTDPANPVIGTRSFGADPALVARHTAAFVTGHQRAGVASCVKHYPGHGDTAADTHLALAVLDTDAATLAAQALPPFRAAVEAGVTAVMVGHLLVPAVDTWPATLSRRWLVDILRDQMGFTGAVVTDALEMGAIAGSHGIGEAAVLAVAAGADLLCLGGEDAGEHMVDQAAGALIRAVTQGRLSRERLADAAARTRWLGRPGVPAQGGPPGLGGSEEVALAGRALEIAGPLPAATAPVLILRCQATQNIAVGATPWGPAQVWPAAREQVVAPGGALPLDLLGPAGTVVLVTRDRHRHPFMAEVITAVRSVRADAVVVEMGTTGLAGLAGPAVASYGATQALAQAVVAALGGRSARGTQP